jgi:hypothetical protein
LFIGNAKTRKQVSEVSAFRRCLDECGAYEEMGNTRDFIRELKRTLPAKDERYLLFTKEP